MRVTNKTLVNTFLNNLNNNLTKMSKYQDQMASGKEIRKPSDDPFGATRSMELNTAINRNDQYLRNIDDSIGWLDTTDTALGQVNDSLQRIRELMISSASGTKSQTDIDANKMEIIQRIEEIAQAGNTMFDGKYIFAGNQTTNAPFASINNGDISYSGDDGPINREIAPNVILKINVTGEKMMNGAGVNLGVTLSSIRDALDLNSADFPKISGSLLDDITKQIDNALNLRGEAGAKANRMESARAKNEEETYNTTEILSKVEDIDLAEKIMQYKVMENVYNSSLMTNAKILQQSLIDFLR